MTLDQQTLAQIILDADFNREATVEHGDDKTPSSTDVVNYEDIEHYGVLGMKWGVRKDRRQKGESESEYKIRIAKQEREEAAKRQEKAKAKEAKAKAKVDAAKQKRVIKERKDQQKREIKKQIELEKNQIKLQGERERAILKAQREQQRETMRLQRERQEVELKQKKTSSRKAPVRTMSDEELNAAINRIKKEMEYKKLTSPAVQGSIDIGKKVVAGVATAVATKYLTEYVTNEIDKRRKSDSKKGGS